jgi:hypothetical protein
MDVTKFRADHIIKSADICIHLISAVEKAALVLITQSAFTEGLKK